MDILISPGYGSSLTGYFPSEQELWLRTHEGAISSVKGEQWENKVVRDLDIEIILRHFNERFGDDGDVDEWSIRSFFSDKLTIHSLPTGTKFQIREYDGAEHIETFDEAHFFTAS